MAASLALALLWVYLVPLLQGSDESDHVDYVVSLARAGHLLRADHPLGQPAADLETDFLETYTDFPDIYLNGTSRETDGYGSHAFFTEIDRRSRQQLPDAHAFFNAPQHPVPVLVSMYPFGYYAANALWLDIFDRFDDSLVSLFFAARWFSATMVVVTVLASYGTLRELDCPPPGALLLAGIVGTFPLTTFVSSYVQPDSTSTALVALTFLAAMRYRRTMRPRDAALVGLSLGALTITKYQFGLCVGLAVGFAAIAELIARRRSWRAIVSTFGLVAGPAVALLVVQTLLVGSNKAFAADTSRHFAAFTGMATLPDDARRFAIRLAQGAWYSFVGNLTPVLTTDKRYAAAISFWGVFGWLDTPLTFGNAAVDGALRLVIQSLTIILFAATTVVMLRRLGRLVGLARRGRVRASVRLAAKNVPVNAYLLFIAFMLVFYALTDNAWRTSGRNWAPMVLPAFLLGSRYAPRVFSPRTARNCSAAVLASLATYCVVGGAYAAQSIERRYYGRSPLADLSKLAPARPSSVVVDTIDGFESKATPLAMPYVRAGTPLAVSGYAIDLPANRSAGGVVVTIDGREKLVATYGFAHQDVSERLGDPALFWSGFELAIPTANLGRGPHVATFAVVSHDDRTIGEAPGRLAFVVVNAAQRFEPLERAAGRVTSWACEGDIPPIDAATSGSACATDETLRISATLAPGERGRRTSLLVDGLTIAVGSPDGAGSDSVSIRAPLRHLKPGFHNVSIVVRGRGEREATIARDVPVAIFDAASDVRAFEPLAPTPPFAVRVGRYHLRLEAFTSLPTPPQPTPLWIEASHPVRVVVRATLPAAARMTLVVDGRTTSRWFRRSRNAFEASVPTDGIEVGPHSFAIVIVENGRTATSETVPFTIYR